MTSIIGGLIKKVTSEAKRLSTVTASGRMDEEFTGCKAIQEYGLASCPPEGAECLLVRSGQNVYMIASDDRRYRIALKEGEVAIYDNNDSVIHLQNGGKIVIESKSEITVKSDSVTVDAKDVAINSGGIYLGPKAASATAGKVLVESLVPAVCPFTASPHVPIARTSGTVKAAL